MTARDGPSEALPPDWKLAPLAEVAEILDSRRRPLNAAERSRMRGPFPYYGANGPVDRISEWLFDEPLILMAEDGGYFDEFASRPIAYLVDGKCWINNHAHVLRVSAPHDRRWVFYSLVHRDIRSYINSATRAKLNQEDLRRIPVPLPPLAEQRKIAAILSSVDEALEKTQAVIDQVQVVKKGLMQELFTRGLPGKTETGPGEDRGSPPPGQWDTTTAQRRFVGGVVPAGWAMIHLGDIFQEIVETGSTRERSVLAVTIDRGVVRRDSLDRKQDRAVRREQYRVVRPGDLVYNTMRMWQGASGLVAEEGYVSPAYTVVRPDTDECSAFWAHYFKDRSTIRRFHEHSQGFAKDRYRLYFRHFATVPALRPSLPEQREIAAALDAHDKRLDVETRFLDSLRRTKSALMSVLLTGEVRVTPGPETA